MVRAYAVAVMARVGGASAEVVDQGEVVKVVKVVMTVMMVMALVATVSEEKVNEAARWGAGAWVKMALLVVPRVAAYPSACTD